MRILVTNDDGIDAVGINVLANALCKDNHVTMIAPDTERSASSHSLTIHRDITFLKKDGYNFDAYAISGTPADCVKLGVLYLKKGEVDLVVSGINNGSNLGSDIMYSGTVSAAFEASYLGIPAIAVSLNKWNCNTEKYAAAADFVCRNLSQILALKLSPETVININYPTHMPCKGVKVTKVGINLYDDTFIDGETHGSLRLKGVPVQHDRNQEDCDVELCAKGYVTVSPLNMDRNDYKALELIKSAVEFK